MNQTVQQITQAFTANQSISNLFVGQRLADLPASFGSRFKVTICAVSSAAGVQLTVNAGNRATPVHESQLSVASTAGRLVVRDDVLCTFVAEAGEKIIAQALETAGGMPTAVVRLIVQPIN